MELGCPPGLDLHLHGRVSADMHVSTDERTCLACQRWHRPCAIRNRNAAPALVHNHYIMDSGGALCCRPCSLPVSREMWNYTEQSLDDRELGPVVHFVLLRAKNHLEASF
jgi:hypothetical protein